MSRYEYDEGEYRTYTEGYDKYSEKPIVFDKPKIDCKEGQLVTSGRWHLDARGSLMEVYRASWYAEPAGPVQQVYISTTAPGVVKAWHLHMHQMDRFVCVRGKVLVACCRHGEREVQTVVLDAERGPRFVHIPPGTAHGWKSIGQEESWILNLCTHEYDGTDEYRRDAHEGPWINVPFDWNKCVDG